MLFLLIMLQRCNGGTEQLCELLVKKCLHNSNIISKKAVMDMRSPFYVRGTKGRKEGKYVHRKKSIRVNTLHLD